MAISSDTATAPLETKGRLLDVAERLFAEHGFDAVSLRAITAEAEANLAAVNYHFGSKEALIGAVFARQVEPINRRRMLLLDRASDVRSIVEAFLEPVIEAAARSGPDGQRFCKLMSRCMAARDERISELVMRQFPAVVERFVAAIGECCPGLSSDSIYLRVLFMAGGMGHSLFHHDKMAIVSGGRCEVPELEALKAEMVAFFSAGLEAGSARRGVES